MKLAQAAFGDWKAKGRRCRKPRPPPSPPSRCASCCSARQRAVDHAPGRPGIPASADEQVPLRLASTILGGGFSAAAST
jgi:zinc protease